MFSRNLHGGDPSKATKNPDPNYPEYRLGDFGYGKDGIKILQLKKNGSLHMVTEYRVNVHMRLKTHKEYYEANNTDIIGSDVMATNVYIHAQKYGLQTPEEFALSLTQYFLDTYELAMESNVIVEEMSWQRLGSHGSQGLYQNEPHEHAFLQNMNGRRRCEVVRKRNDPKPLLIGGIDELQMLKSARAPFVGYLKGSLFTEGDNADRILSVDVNARWEYKTIEGIDFASHWHRVRDILIESFAEKIITSVQYYTYAAEPAILKAMPEISSVSISLKNIPQEPYDFSRFPPFEPKADVVIVKPCDEPHSVAHTQTDRLDSKL